MRPTEHLVASGAAGFVSGVASAAFNNAPIPGYAAHLAAAALALFTWLFLTASGASVHIYRCLQEDCPYQEQRPGPDPAAMDRVLAHPHHTS